MSPIKGAVIGALAGVVVVVLLILYLFTSIAMLVLPYIAAIAITGMTVYGVLAETLGNKKDRTSDSHKSPKRFGLD